MNRPTGVSLLTVATGRYLDYWKQQATDADRHLFPSAALQILVFTDRVAEARDLQDSLSRAEITVVPIAPLGWPEATAHRYELIAGAKDLISGDLLMHLDADMRIHGSVGEELDPASWVSGLALVRHPGFYRAGLKSWHPRQPRTVLRDVRMRVQVGGIGAWEQRQQSRAYVERRRRRVYVCGGVWLGLREPFLNLAWNLAERTRIDATAGVMARWHDESHLNWFAAHHPVTLLDPRYCFVVGRTEETGLPCVIEAVDKGDNRVR